MPTAAVLRRAQPRGRAGRQDHRQRQDRAGAAGGAAQVPLPPAQRRAVALLRLRAAERGAQHHLHLSATSPTTATCCQPADRRSGCGSRRPSAPTSSSTSRTSRWARALPRQPAQQLVDPPARPADGAGHARAASSSSTATRPTRAGCRPCCEPLRDSDAQLALPSHADHCPVRRFVFARSSGKWTVNNQFFNVNVPRAVDPAATVPTSRDLGVRQPRQRLAAPDPHALRGGAAS